MPSRDFSPATAEQVVLAVDAVGARKAPVRSDFVADFMDLPIPQAESALELAVDLGLLSKSGGRYSSSSPLCRFLATPNLAQRAAVLRVVLESYEPFNTFRERLAATGSAQVAGQQTKVALDLSAHREAVKDTLVSLGTYSDALITLGGGQYAAQPGPMENPLQVLALAAGDQAASEGLIRGQLGPEAAKIVSRDEVILPLASALLRANSHDARGAVVDAGNAIESYLLGLGARAAVVLTGAHGINAKLDRFDQVGWMSKKIIMAGKHLGHVRNAADHGIDPDVGVTWIIRRSTGTEYVFLACSFVAAVTVRELDKPAEI